MPTYRIGAPQFVAAHPTYDGRGVKVGIVDTGVDLDRPELQTALDLTAAIGPEDLRLDDEDAAASHRPGERRPDLGAAHDGDAERQRPEHLDRPPASTSCRRRSRGRRTPSSSGVFVEGDPRLGGELGSDVNQDGDTNDTFGVLEDTATRTVWVDTTRTTTSWTTRR